MRHHRRFARVNSTRKRRRDATVHLHAIIREVAREDLAVAAKPSKEPPVAWVGFDVDIMKRSPETIARRAAI